MQTFDELSDYFKLETRIRVNKHLVEDPSNEFIAVFAWLWRFTSEDLTSFLIDLLFLDPEILAVAETLSLSVKESIFSFGLIQRTYYYNGDEDPLSYIGLGLGDFVPLEASLELNKWYDIEVSQIKVTFPKES